MPSLDRLGRRRHPDQHRGLRSLFPTLPTDCRSRLVRVAMSTDAWVRLEELMAATGAPTAPRAIGSLIEQWMTGDPVSVSTAPPRAIETAPMREVNAATDWQDWQIRKELALLASVKSNPVADQPTVH